MTCNAFRLQFIHKLIPVNVVVACSAVDNAFPFELDSRLSLHFVCLVAVIAGDCKMGARKHVSRLLVLRNRERRSPEA